MRTAKLRGVCAWMCLAALPCYLVAQEGGAPATLDSPRVKADIEKAKKDAGTMWANEQHFFCEAPMAIAPMIQCGSRSQPLRLPLFRLPGQLRSSASCL
jgi:hypothetical protein